MSQWREINLTAKRCHDRRQLWATFSPDVRLVANLHSTRAAPLLPPPQCNPQAAVNMPPTQILQPDTPDRILFKPVGCIPHICPAKNLLEKENPFGISLKQDWANALSTSRIVDFQLSQLATAESGSATLNVCNNPVTMEMLLFPHLQM